MGDAVIVGVLILNGIFAVRAACGRFFSAAADNRSESAQLQATMPEVFSF
jgi:hypothetical protein